jgi:hypothetical protein
MQTLRPRRPTGHKTQAARRGWLIALVVAPGKLQKGTDRQRPVSAPPARQQGMNRTMTATTQVVVWASPHHIVLESRRIPDAGPDEALLRIRRAGICGTDYHISTGTSLPASSRFWPIHT